MSRLSWTPLTEAGMAAYERYLETVVASEPFDAEGTLSWLRRDGAPPEDFFIVGAADSRIVADLEFYRDGEEGTLRFDVSADQADLEAYTALINVALDRIPASVRTVTTSSAESLRDKCAAIVRSGFRSDGRTMFLSAGIDTVRPDVLSNFQGDLAGLTISPLRRDRDLPEFTRLHNAVFETIPGSRPIMPAKMEDMVTETLRAGQSILVAAIGGVPVGWAWSCLETEDGSVQLFVESIGVRPEHRRRGIGRSLLAAALEGFRYSGLTRILASVDDRNEVSRQFFERLGLRAAESKNWYLREFD